MTHPHRPIGFELKFLRTGEMIEMILRRHWITLFYLGLYIFFLVVSSALLFLFKETLSEMFVSEVFWLILVTYWSVFLMVIYVFWINNELDFLIITNQRVIGLEQRSFLDRNIAECSIDRIQEVDARTTGLLSNLLDFGKLTVHTASDTSHFVLEYAANPLENARHILNITHEHRNSIKIQKAGGV